MTIIAVIPARRDSKRLPGKNRMKINGKTLVEHAVDSAASCKLIDWIVIFSNDKEVEDKYIDFLLEPEELAGDDVPVKKYIDYIESKYDYDILVLLQPTSPIRDSDDIDRCINLLITGNLDSVVTVGRHLTSTFLPNGNIYVVRRGKPIYSDNMACLVLDKRHSVDIDTAEDLVIANALL